MIVVWTVTLLLGFGAAAFASRRAVDAALDVVDAFGVSAGLVGVSVMAIGTDLPEIATSIMAALSGHGDLVVGDATGSALTQVTLILALLLVAAGSIDLRATDPDESPVAVPVGLMCVGALLGLAVLLADGRLQRWNGAVLVAAWFASLWWMQRRERAVTRSSMVPGEAGGAAARTVGWLGAVGIAASVTVRSFVEVTDAVGVPEFIASTIVLALGTSMPELVVDWTAIRRGVAALAIGDLFGSSLVDSTLSVGIGPMFAATDVSPEAVDGTLVIAVGMAVTTLIVATVTRRRQLATALFLTYLATTVVLVSLAGAA
jgi:cation:H+ antiporter